MSNCREIIRRSEDFGLPSGEGSSESNQRKMREHLLVAAEKKRQEERSARASSSNAVKMRGAHNELWRKDLHGLLMGGTAFKLVMGIIGLFVGLYVMSGLLSLVRLMADGSLLVRCLAGAFFVVAVGGVAFCAFQTWKLLRRLPSIEQVIRADVAKLRAGDAKLSDEELGRVCDYVAAYSSDEREQSNELSERIGRLKNMVRKEDGAHAVKDSAEFVKKFIEFQDEQRKKADEIVLRYRNATGVATAGCPWKAGDMLIVLCNTVLMTCAIARVYGRKMDSSQALRYVFRWIGNLYLAGQMQDLTEGVTEKLKGVLPDDWLTGLNAAFLSAGGKILGKLGEGAANALLLHRLGQQAIRSFEALREPQS